MFMESRASYTLQLVLKASESIYTCPGALCAFNGLSQSQAGADGHPPQDAVKLSPSLSVQVASQAFFLLKLFFFLKKRKQDFKKRVEYVCFVRSLCPGRVELPGV